MVEEDKVNDDTQDIQSKILLGISIILGICGIVVLIWFLIILSYEFDIASDKVKLAETAQVGDFIGGLVGSLWALTGIVLFYLALRLQRKEFKLQRTELSNQRKEFQINRLTDIILEQNRKFDSATQRLELSDPDSQQKFQGRKALLSLRDNLNPQNILDDNSWSNLDIDSKSKLAENNSNDLHVVSRNEEQIFDFVLEVYSCVDVIKRSLLVSSLNIKEQNQLKDLFFRTIGFMQLQPLERIYCTWNNAMFIYGKQGGDHISEGVLGRITTMDTFLTTIHQYRELKITPEWNTSEVDRIKQEGSI